MTRSDIRICASWQDEHERPVYGLGRSCPKCGGEMQNSAPAPFSPTDPHGAYRRALKRRVRD